MTHEPPRAAIGKFPCPHRTMEEVWAAERAQRAVDLREFMARKDKRP